MPGSAVARLRRASKALALVLVAFLVLAVVAVGSLRWVDPPLTSVMLLSGGPRHHEWVDADAIGSPLALAVLANEDQGFAGRTGGVDVAALRRRAHDPEHRGGSTLQEQLAKNVFLWKHKDLVRKVLLEPPLATLVSLEVGKRRTLELYLNVAQTGPHLWGVCEAAWAYFDTAPSSLTLAQASELVAALPLADRVHRAAGGGIAFPPDRPLAATDALLRTQALAATSVLTDVGWPQTSRREGSDSCNRRPRH